MSAATKTVMALVLVLVGCAQVEQRLPEQPPLDGRAILDHVFATYRDCKAYADSGEATTETFFVPPVTDSPPMFESHTAFTTSYSVEDGLRFDADVTYMGSAIHSYEIARDASGAQFTGFGRAPKQCTLEEAVWLAGGATGSLGRPLRLVGALLFPADFFVTVDSLMQNPEFVGYDDVPGVGACLHVLGHDAQGNACELWVDPESYLVRKWQEVHHFGEVVRRVQTANFDPSIVRQR